MTQEEMWKAVSENDASYDGIFFYAVKSTGIYCRPSCKSKNPKRENVSFFNTAEQAIAAGFSPCKRCRSDLSEYQPIKEIAEKVKKLLDESFRGDDEINNELQHMGLSHRRMVQIFKDEYGITVSEYIKKLRLKEAKRLLSETNDKIIDIAYAIGFGGLSSFYRFFKINTGLSPAAYRNEYGNNYNREARKMNGWNTDSKY
ncbi:Ada metal-binding domain-containing protein [Sedimentibacter sp.]|uniref:bifunctional transcriptional activator/DNA repair enzyme AdaA n=1 Tax=Sedimentibacter sp. TaxID=1960295 RepID=UPI00289CC27D|nr:Ada metal-binding domain-containing protein [Sedimentibacter sp.]